MNIIKYALIVAALSLPLTKTHALEWVDYDGTIPDNAVSVIEGTEDRPICRRNARIGLIKNHKCHSVKAGGSFDKKEIDDGYQILVDTYNVYDAVQADTDMFTQTDVDDAVAEATEDMYTQAEYDAAVGAGANAVYTQDEYEDAVIEGVNKGIEITAAEIGLACANKAGQFSNNINEAKLEYMEGICSGQVSNSGYCSD